MRIAVGSDHLGLRLKESLHSYLEEAGHSVVDYGCYDDTAVDYPDVGVVVAQAVAANEVERAVLICGTGLGMSMVANKVPGVRAAAVSDPYSAERAIKSNDAQVLCLGSNVVGVELAKVLLDHWLRSEFGGGDSARKVNKIGLIDHSMTPTV